MNNTGSLRFPFISFTCALSFRLVFTDGDKKAKKPISRGHILAIVFTLCLFTMMIIALLTLAYWRRWTRSGEPATNVELGNIIVVPTTGSVEDRSTPGTPPPPYNANQTHPDPPAPVDAA